MTGVSFVSASASQGSRGCTGTSTIACRLGDLTAGASATVTIEITPTTAGQIENTIAVSAKSTDSNTANNSATESTTVTDGGGPLADVSLIKSDSQDPVNEGENVTYTLTVVNNGPDAASNVVVTDTLPAGVNFVSATPSQGSCSGAATVSCSLGAMANGANATVDIEVETTTAQVLSNTASVGADESDSNTVNNSDTEETTVNGTGGGTHILTIDVQGPGSVTSNPAGIDCPDISCSADFGENSSVELTASPDPGSSFRGWRGACSGSDPVCSVNMASDQSATARFR